VKKIYWIDVSRKQVWETVASKEEIKGSWEAFMELGRDPKVLDGLLGGMSI